MARKLTPKQVFNDLMMAHEPKLAAAFMEAVADLKSVLDHQRFTAALAAGNVEAALAALNLDEGAYDDLLEAMRATYLEAGKATADNLPARLAVVRFGGRNLRAEAWLRERAATFVTRILEDQRVAIREVLVAGMEAGTAPRALTIRIVGRISRVSGKREGGILGLSSPQARSVTAAQTELASADPALLRKYLARTRRDRRFDRSVTKALREGRALPADIASKALTAYERRLLALRGETIARTEAMTALHAAQHEALQQAVDSGALQANQVRRVWRSAGDRRVRHTHQAMNGDSAGLHEVFVSPGGAALRFPGDPLAPVEEIVNCRCWCEPRIDFYSNIR